MFHKAYRIINPQINPSTWYCLQQGYTNPIPAPNLPFFMVVSPGLIWLGQEMGKTAILELQEPAPCPTKHAGTCRGRLCSWNYFRHQFWPLPPCSLCLLPYSHLAYSWEYNTSKMVTCLTNCSALDFLAFLPRYRLLFFFQMQNFLKFSYKTPFCLAPKTHD